MKWVKVLMVIVGALVVTALGIDAADTLSGKGGTLIARVLPEGSVCPDGMDEVEAVPGITCVDRYEASAGNECPVAVPQSMIDSTKNAETGVCHPTSVSGRQPWTFVSREQAMQLCARAGKRLPTSAEWYGLALGMVDVESSCNVDGGSPRLTGATASCVSPGGTFDLIGNVWEWMSDDVMAGAYGGRDLPESGYVSGVDSTGVAVSTTEGEQDQYGKDYFWGGSEGVSGLIRGGYYDSGTDGGLYAVHANTPPSAASAGVGFRCVR